MLQLSSAQNQAQPGTAAAAGGFLLPAWSLWLFPASLEAGAGEENPPVAAAAVVSS